MSANWGTLKNCTPVFVANNPKIAILVVGFSRIPIRLTPEFVLKIYFLGVTL